MPSARHARRAITILVIALAALGAAAPPAQADHVPAAVRRIDDQIHHAERVIQRWQRKVTRWQVRVGHAAAHVQRLTYREAAATETDLASSVALLLPGLVVVPRGKDPVAEAHRELQRLLRNHAAQEALQQQWAWQTYSTRLQRAREHALTAASRHQAVSIPDGPVTFESWAQLFLSSVGAPTCDENVLLVVAWETQESTQALFNPLATTHAMEGATDFNDVGVKNYVSLEQGLEASATPCKGVPSRTGTPRSWRRYVPARPRKPRPPKYGIQRGAADVATACTCCR